MVGRRNRGGAHGPACRAAGTPTALRAGNVGATTMSRTSPSASATQKPSAGPAARCAAWGRNGPTLRAPWSIAAAACKAPWRAETTVAEQNGARGSEAAERRQWWEHERPRRIHENAGPRRPAGGAIPRSRLLAHRPWDADGGGGAGATTREGWLIVGIFRMAGVYGHTEIRRGIATCTRPGKHTKEWVADMRKVQGGWPSSDRETRQAARSKWPKANFPLPPAHRNLISHHPLTSSLSSLLSPRSGPHCTHSTPAAPAAS